MKLVPKLRYIDLLNKKIYNSTVEKMIVSMSDDENSFSNIQIQLKIIDGQVRNITLNKNVYPSNSCYKHPLHFINERDLSKLLRGKVLKIKMSEGAKHEIIP